VIPAQKFAVGEVVMIRSESHPEQNCDNAVVTDALFNEWEGTDGMTHITWGYRTDNDSIEDIDYWTESALRKRPPPSTQSFDELMREANKPLEPA